LLGGAGRGFIAVNDLPLPSIPPAHPLTLARRLCFARSLSSGRSCFFQPQLHRVGGEGHGYFGAGVLGMPGFESPSCSSASVSACTPTRLTSGYRRRVPEDPSRDAASRVSHNEQDRHIVSPVVKEKSYFARNEDAQGLRALPRCSAHGI